MNNLKAENIAQDFLKLLADHNQYYLLPEITEILQKEVYKNQEVTVVSAVEIEEKDQKQIKELLISKWGEHKVNWLVDPMLLSGLTIKFQNQIIDASGKNQIQSLAQALK